MTPLCQIGIHHVAASGNMMPTGGRYDHVAYEAAASAAQPLLPPAELVGEPAETPWDPELAAVMRHRNLRIEEELTLDALLQDLSP